mmetsp:Transcript_50045/g.121252  ORF Transcript_50045/g.121252 Transcript_50045/m.121252 type:complete len:285 (+) Transcript_50045:169-1023(+)
MARRSASHHRRRARSFSGRFFSGANLITVSIVVATLLLLSCRSSFLAYGFPNGAGGCVGGGPAVGGTHIISAPSGSLKDGNITVTVGETLLETGQSPITMVADGDTKTSVSVSGGPKGVFKGVLVRFEVPVRSGSDEFFEDFSSVDRNVKDAAETCLNSFTSLVFGYTHNNSNDKEFVVANYTVGLDDDTSGTLDVTVVIQNSGGVSEYYYSGYDVSFITATPSPTSMPVDVPVQSPSPAAAPDEPGTPPSGALSSTITLLSIMTTTIAIAAVFTGFVVGVTVT